MNESTLADFARQRLVKFLSSTFFPSRFNSSSHVYFATVQKKSYLPGEAEAGFVTRISRTCITDANFDTYSEVTLQCHLEGENYNLLQAATLVPASKKVKLMMVIVVEVVVVMVVVMEINIGLFPQ